MLIPTAASKEFASSLPCMAIKIALGFFLLTFAPSLCRGSLSILTTACSLGRRQSIEGSSAQLSRNEM